MTWTKKHDEFALMCDLSKSESAILLARFLMRRAKLSEPTEVELDFHVFNKWVGKRRVKGEYHRKTLTTAIEKLDERSHGMFVILKKYSPWYYKILVRPLSFVEKIESAKENLVHKHPTENPMFDEDRKMPCNIQQQQDISKIDTLFSQLGMKYTQDALTRIWRLAGKSIDEVKNAVELLLFQHSIQEEKIRNPHGWVISCLRNGWQKGLNLYYQVDLPYFSHAQDIEKFVEVGMIPQSVTV